MLWLGNKASEYKVHYNVTIPITLSTEQLLRK